jgi:hypothetical protein
MSLGPPPAPKANVGTGALLAVAILLGLGIPLWVWSDTAFSGKEGPGSSGLALFLLTPVLTLPLTLPLWAWMRPRWPEVARDFIQVILVLAALVAAVLVLSYAVSGGLVLLQFLRLR